MPHREMGEKVIIGMMNEVKEVMTEQTQNSETYERVRSYQMFGH